MSFLSSFLGSLGLSGDTGGSVMGSNILGMFMSPFNAGMDSLGLSQHGRDQYFARDLQRELLWDQINAQKEENQLNRDFSKEMLDLNWQKTLQNYPELLKMSSDNAFNLWRNQFNIQRDYNEQVNSPAGQVSRMMAAGLYPAQGAQTQVASQFGGSHAAPPPNIQGSPLGGSVSPIGLPQGLSGRGSDLASLGSFIRDLSTSRLQGAQETGQNILNEINQKTIEDQIKAIALKNKWTDEQTSFITQSFNEMTARINTMLKQNELTDKQIKYFEKEMDAKINDLQQSAEYHKALAGLTDEQKRLLTDMFDDLKKYQMYSAQQMEKFAKLLDKYGDAQAIVGMLSEIVKSGVSIAELFTPKKVIKTITGGDE